MTQTVEDLAQRYFARGAEALGRRELRVLTRMAKRAPLSRNADEIAESKSGFWDRLADRVAAIGGSWPFIFGFFAVLVGWMLLNSRILAAWGMTFDPYPYIFLNLMLSMLAAIQAPIIMMSQNRAAAKDRIAAEHDYEVNLRAELEIMRLHEKVDALRGEQLAVLARQQSEMLALLRRGAGPAAEGSP